MKHGLKDLETKPIAKILPSGLIKYYNTDGSINEKHHIGFYYKNAENILKADGYKVII